MNKTVSASFPPLHFPTVLKTMKKLWWLPFTFTVLGGILGVALAVVVIVPVYDCQASFLYSPKHTAVNGIVPPLTLDTYFNILKLPSTVETIGASLGLEPEKAAKIFEVDVSKDGKLLTIYTKDSSPERSYEYITAVTREFLASQIRERKMHARGYLDLYQARLTSNEAEIAALEDRLHQSQAKLSMADIEFQQQHDVVDISKEKELYLQKLVDAIQQNEQAQINLELSQVKMGQLRQITEALEKQVEEESGQKKSGMLPADINFQKQRLSKMMEDIESKKIWKKELAVKKRELARLHQLMEKGIVSESQVEIAKKEIEVVEARLHESPETLQLKKTLEDLQQYQPADAAETVASRLLKELQLQFYDLEIDQAVLQKKIDHSRKEKDRIRKRLPELANLQRKYTTLLADLQKQRDSLQLKLDEARVIAQKQRSDKEGAWSLANFDQPDFVEVSSAKIPTKSSHIRRSIVIAGIAFVFFIFGILFALFKACFSPTMRSGGEAETRLHRAALEVFPDYTEFDPIHVGATGMNGNHRDLPTMERDEEKFRNLAAKVTACLQGGKGWIVMLAEVDQMIGPSTLQSTGYGIGQCANDMGYRTLIVDMTLPTGDYLNSQQLGQPYPEVLEVIEHLPDSNRVYNWGAKTGPRCVHYLSPVSNKNKRDVLYTETFCNFLEKAKEHYQLILLLAPSTWYEADFRTCSRHAEGSIVIVRTGREPSWKYDKVIVMLEEEKCPILGLSIVGVKPPYCKVVKKNGNYTVKCL